MYFDFLPLKDLDTNYPPHTPINKLIWCPATRITRDQNKLRPFEAIWTLELARLNFSKYLSVTQPKRDFQDFGQESLPCRNFLCVCILLMESSIKIQNLSTLLSQNIQFYSETCNVFFQLCFFIANGNFPRPNLFPRKYQNKVYEFSSRENRKRLQALLLKFREAKGKNGDWKGFEKSSCNFP